MKQYHPLTLAAARKLTDGKVANHQIGEILRYCSLVSLRHNLIADKNTHDLEKTYNEVAADIHEGRLPQPTQIRDALRTVAVSDEESREAFGGNSIPASGKRKRLVRYLLVKLDRQLGNQALGDDCPSVTVEHILPENLASAREASFTPEQHVRYASRLGNYTLLTPFQNRDVAQKNIAEKSTVYRTSNFLLIKRLDVTDWNPSSIERRQREMANWAATVLGGERSVPTRYLLAWLVAATTFAGDMPKVPAISLGRMRERPFPFSDDFERMEFLSALAIVVRNRSVANGALLAEKCRQAVTAELP